MIPERGFSYPSVESILGLMKSLIIPKADGADCDEFMGRLSGSSNSGKYSSGEDDDEEDDDDEEEDDDEKHGCNKNEVVRFSIRDVDL
jgi:hypothetical protein